MYQENVGDLSEVKSELKFWRSSKNLRFRYISISYLWNTQWKKKPAKTDSKITFLPIRIWFYTICVGGSLPFIILWINFSHLQLALMWLKLILATWWLKSILASQLKPWFKPALAKIANSVLNLFTLKIKFEVEGQGIHFRPDFPTRRSQKG